jgi:tripartite ATP-independent transporter DctM subunit
MSTVALMGVMLVPEMEKRGYKRSMSLGPILGSGGLAIMIPPSSLAIIVAALGKMSVAGVLIGGIVPGLLLALFFAAYIIIRCQLRPSIAPPYQPPPTPLSEKVGAFMKYVLPLGIVIFLVTGVIFVGIATPSEAAATGTFGALILAILYRGLSWNMLKRVLWSTLNMTTMIFIIIAGSQVFSQILAISGASAGLAEWVVGLPIPPIAIIIGTQLVLLVLGMFMGAVSMIMITMPIFMPIVRAVGIDPVWFGLLVLLNMEIAQITPPFGLSLFVMQGVAPPGTTTGEIWRASMPYVTLNLLVLALMLAFPAMVLWLPGLIR